MLSLIYGWPQNIKLLDPPAGPRPHFCSSPPCLQPSKGTFCAFISKRILNLTQIISVPPRADAYLRVVRSFSRFMLICLRPIALLRSARLWQRRGGALPPCNFIFAPSFGFLPDYIHTYIEGVVMRFHIIEKLSQNFDFVTILMILTF